MKMLTEERMSWTQFVFIYLTRGIRNRSETYFFVILFKRNPASCFTVKYLTMILTSGHCCSSSHTKQVILCLREKRVGKKRKGITRRKRWKRCPYTVLWHYESWRLLNLTSDVFWSSQWASGEGLDDSSAERQREATAVLNGSCVWNKSGVNVFIRRAEGRRGEERRATVTDAGVTSGVDAVSRNSIVPGGGWARWVLDRWKMTDLQNAWQLTKRLLIEPKKGWNRKTNYDYSIFLLIK